MRVRLVALFLFICTLAWGAPSTASATVVFYAQTDASAQSTLPPRNNGVGQVFVPAISGNAKTIAIRTTYGNNGSIDCSQTSNGNIMRLAIRPANATSSQPIWNGDFAWYIASSTPPDVEGNCFYNSFHTADAYQNYYYYPYSNGALTDGALVAGDTYIVFIDDQYLRWDHDSFGGSLSGTGAGSLNGPGVFTSGSVGVGSYFITISDTPLFVSDHNVGISGTTTPAAAPPSITLTGGATTTTEFGSTFTDPGSTAHDTADGDLTGAIQITGSVDTGVMGTTTLTYAVTNSHGLSATTTRAVVVACTHDCYSSVLFLPGIEGSRLYRPDYASGTDKLWEPNIDSDVKDLYMNPDGTSARFDVYAKERDVIDELPNGENIYKSFIEKMDDFKTNGTIAGWEPIAYDWRLSLDDILTYGNDVQGRIYYSGDLRATSTPYVIQELKHLAATSKTRKVTIVAHSNGGLLAKRLTEILGAAESAEFIDKMIFVAVPQVGTPTAIAAGMHGYEQDNVFGLVTSKSTARTLASAAPMEYQLLPSQKYFTYVDEPVVTFDASLTDWISRYGSIIHSQDRLNQFLTDTFGRVDPETGDINQPIQFSGALLSNAETLHTSLDTWVPPTGVQLTQIAGWGVPKTVEGITYKKKGSGVAPEPNFTVDGDGTVVVPSALWTSTTTGATNYWVDLKRYSNDHWVTAMGGFHPFNHGKILETDPVLDFVSDQIINTNKTISDYVYLSTEAPANSGKRLRYSLHSPLTLNLYDAAGRHTGVSTSTGQVEEQIPDTYYTEFGDVKYLFSDASAQASIIMNGYADGAFTLNIDEYSGNTLTTSTTFKDVPTTASTVASLSVQSDSSTLSSMVVDKNSDGNTFIIATRVGETVSYEPPAPALVVSSGGGGAWSPAPVIAPVATTTSSMSTSIAGEIVTAASSTQAVATGTSMAILSNIKPLQTRKMVAMTPVTQLKKVSAPVAQTASVYGASQQPVLKKLGEAVYNGLYGFWVTFKNFFH